MSTNSPSLSHAESSTPFLTKEEASTLWNKVAEDFLFNLQTLTEGFTPSQSFSQVAINTVTNCSVKLGGLMKFDSHILTESSGDSDIDDAVGRLLPLMLRPPLMPSFHTLELVFRKVVEELLSPLCKTVTLEHRYNSDLEGDKGTRYLDNIECAYIGIGSPETLHGSPDARIRGCVSSNLETIHSCSALGGGDGEETDGGTMTVEGKRELKGPGSTGRIPHASQLIATNITASFIEHNLHPEMNTLIPSLLLNSKTAIISLYDCQQDILMISEPLALCHDEDESGTPPKGLKSGTVPSLRRAGTGVLMSSTAIFILWLFINHRLFLSAIDPEQVHPDKGIPPSGVLARLELNKKLDSFQKLRRKNQDWRKITGASSEDRSIPVVTYEGIPLRKKRKMGGSCRSPRPSPSDGPGSNTDQT